MTDSGDLSVNTSCALEGGDCLAALIDDQTAIYVEDTTPTDETDYQARFLFNPNSLTMTSGDDHDIFQALDDTVVAFQVQLKENGASYDIRLQVNDDNPSPQTTSWETISDDVNEIVVEWWADTDGGADSGGDDGSARLWIDGELKGTLTDIDNDTHQVDKTRLGAPGGIDAGTFGPMYFDNYASWTEAEGMVYDGTGRRTKTVIDNTTVVYIGGVYEKNVTDDVVITTYNGSAMRVDDGTNEDVYWILDDHLGSTSIIVDVDGQSYSIYGERRYKAWGEERYSSGTNPSTRGYTGQREETDIGLYFYNARWYDPTVGRFLQADTIVPDPYYPQAYDRYAYTFNNPLKYTDDSGNCPWCIVIAVVVIITKVIDYAITAWDIYESGKVLADPNATAGEKLMAGLNIALSAIFELIEPDELLPIGLPADDVARRAVMNGAQEAFEEGGEEALERYLRDALGDNADEILESMAKKYRSFSKRNFRHNLMQRIPIPEGMINPTAHHILPQEFVQKFKNLGVNINDPIWGTWMKGSGFDKWHRNWNKRWGAWLDRNANATAAEIWDFAASLANELGATWP